MGKKGGLENVKEVVVKFWEENKCRSKKARKVGQDREKEL